MSFSAQKIIFFLEKWQFDTLLSKAQRQSQGTFFSEGIFTPNFEE